MITAEGTLAAPLPAFVVEASTAGGVIASASLPADSFPPPEPQSGCFFFFYGAQDTINLQPKDFTIVFTGDAWHLFYIRNHKTYGGGANERNLGHAVSTDLENWTVVARNVLQVPGQWDSLHVWAPHIFRKPNDITYYMFYTGVSLFGNQRIGVATSTNLTTWARESSPVFSAASASWVDPSPGSGYGGQQQLRDPFVMADPQTARGAWLMYYVAVARDRTPGMAVGVATSPGDLHEWHDLRPLWKTSSRLINAGRVESPHAFAHNGNWWVMYTPTYSAADTVRFEVNSTDPANVDTLSWRPHASSQSPSERLYRVTKGYETPWTTLNAWHATEHVVFRGREILAAYDDYNQSIDFLELVAAAPPDSFGTRCPSNVDVEPLRPAVPASQLQLVVGGAMPARSDVRLWVAVPAPMLADLAIYDVQGRRIRRLLNGELPAGTWNVSWDGRDASGGVVGSGVYFARLMCPHAQRVTRIALLR